MNNLERVIDNFQDVIVQLEEIRVNLSKLGLDKRTPETLARQYGKAKSLWTSIAANYATMMDLSGSTAAAFLPKFEAAKAIYIKIQEFLIKNCPEVIEEEKKAEEADYKENPDRPETSQTPAEDPQPSRQHTPQQENTSNCTRTSQKQANPEEQTTQTFATPDHPTYTFVQGVGFVLNTSLSPQPQPQQQPSEALLHALAQLTLNREQRSQAEGSNTDRMGIKIPEVCLREYSGDITKYREFKEQFNSLVIRSRASNIDSFSLLKSKLTGKALEAINDLNMTGDNYPIAWSLLDRTFDNPRHLAKVELEALLVLPQRPTVPGDPESIIAYLHHTKGRVANLRKNEVNGEQIMAYLILRGLDPITRGRLEDSVNSNTKLPTLNEIEDFLFREYQHHLSQDDRHRPHKKESRIPYTKTHATVQPHQPKKCFICTEQHQVMDCPKFLASQNRETLLRAHKICIYCARHRFNYRSPCRSRQFLKCEICHESHITAMHPLPTTSLAEPQASSGTYLCQNQSEASSNVILPTAIATLLVNNETVPIRCLLDQSSQANYISEDLVQKLRLQKKRTLVKVIGVGGEIGTVHSIASLKLKLDHPELAFINIKALVVKRVTGSLPSMASHIPWMTTLDKPLADPHFNRPAHIPLLLGGPAYSTVLRPGLEKKDGLLLQNTYLGGWIVSGDPGSGIGNQTSVYTTLSEFEANLMDFWDMPANKANMDDDDNLYCEKLFMEKHSRTKDGRYIVPIPWKVDAPALGNSFRMAVKFYMGQENRWEKNETHKKMSNDFMEEYLASHHMSPVPAERQRDETGNAYYIPYMSIIRKDAITTKLRNVFNASAPSSNGVSLNQLIHPGPKLQAHIFDIIHQNRQYEIIFTSDMKQMFRQFLIPEPDREKFRIIWRRNKSEPLGEYYLHTVTYGVDCAPWQAIRTVRQIAEDNAPDEETIDIIKNSIYMDDLVHGADSVEQCQKQIDKIAATLEAGKLSLTKWSSNKLEVLNNVDDTKKLSAYKVDSDPTMKILGLNYNQIEDVYFFQTSNPDKIEFTKRGLLSVAASLYDPMGWILPVIMLLRIMIQELWMLKYDWDDLIDEKLQMKFRKILGTFSYLSAIKIPRWIGGNKNTSIQLIGFCDASGDGYAAVIYSRIKTSVKTGNGSTYTIRLLAARGRVTPLKTRANKQSKLCTIPKMELEGIVLLTELYSQVRSQLHSPNITIIAYTDSEVALGWVRNNNEINSKFVKTRVNKIRKIINPVDLHYIKSAENPADPASRGLTPYNLANCQLWFTGPAWLIHDQLPLTPVKGTGSTINHATRNEPEEDNFIERFSGLSRLLRVIAHCLRWASKKETRSTGPLTSEEISNAKARIFRFQQHQIFGTEIAHLKKSRSVPKRSWLSGLMPIFGPDEILRAGGRISLANLPESQRHPIILTKCHLVDLIIRQTHLDHHHSGNSLTEHLIKEEFWIPAVKARVKKCIRSCPVCIRWRAKTIQPIMGDLPSERINPAPAFSKIGVDLCGPFLIKASALRFEKTIKAWVAVFVCLVTKAVHLEICSDLSTDMFLVAFTRFANRRCWPSLVLSDNGTNFIGAKRKINEEWIKITNHSKERLAIQEIVWKLNPPLSPNFGGLWEAAVKSMKHFMKKMSGATNLTYEEFNTLLCRIEGILNSRPLHPDSSEAEDAPALTPFHFITQRSFKNSVIDAGPPTAVPITKRWLQVQQLQQQFWMRFHQEYLHHLQKRNKWKFPTRTLVIGDLVLLQEPSITPADWKMGRIIECYPDDSGNVRRVDVKTTKREVVHRATNRLVPLFPDGAQDEPALRRNNRKQSRTVTLLTRVLLCWLSLTYPSSSGLTIQALSPGIHIQRLEEASVELFNLEFSVETSLNITSDLRSIDTLLEDFSEFCNQYQNNVHSKLNLHCQAVKEALYLEAKSFKDGITASYSQGLSKRSILPALAKNSLTEHLIKEEFWIPAVKARVKKCIRSCPVCIRWRAKTIQPIMGDLPSERINPAPAFSKIGVDLCGPFLIKASALRFEKTIKFCVYRG